MAELDPVKVLKAAYLYASISMQLTAGTAQAGDGVNQAAAKAALLEAYPGLFTISGVTPETTGVPA